MRTLRSHWASVTGPLRALGRRLSRPGPLAREITAQGAATRAAVAAHADQLAARLEATDARTQSAIGDLGARVESAVVRQSESTRTAVYEQSAHVRGAIAAARTDLDVALARAVDQIERLATDLARVADHGPAAVRATAQLESTVVAQAEATRHAIYDGTAQARAQAESTRAYVAELSDLANANRYREAAQTHALLADVSRALADVGRLLTDTGLDRWKVQELEGLVRHVRRREYEADIVAGRLAVPALRTDHPGAPGTDDARFPWGAVNDNSICPRFNSRLTELFAHKDRIAVLDLGCAGGGFVRSLLDDGHFAVGLEGCDVPRVRRLGEWGTIPRHLLTCDITRPFALTDRGTGEPLLFDAVTMWEVMEHIPDADLPGLAANVRSHLAPGGVWICSVSTVDDGNAASGAVYHHTVQPRSWWVERWAQLGFVVRTDHPIGPDDWVRGAGNCRLDRHAESEGVGFHAVLQAV